MRFRTRLRTGCSIGRHFCRRSACAFQNRKFSLFVKLLFTVVAIQLAFWLTFVIKVSPLNLFFDQQTTRSTLPWVIEDDNETDFLFRLTDDDLAVQLALRTDGNRTCFVEGSDFKNGTAAVVSGCPCRADWFGPACSIPGFIQRSPTPWFKDSLRLRSRPRRVVHAFPFNVEFEMVEMLFSELADVVDVFLVLESSFTAYGQPKPLRLLERLRNGSYPQVAGKTVHIFLDYFPAEARRVGWVAEALHRDHLGTRGLRRIAALRFDDLVVLTDADEVPRRQLLSFLKWHDGYSEPVLVSYRWSVFGFFWGCTTPNGPKRGLMHNQELPAVITVAMTIYVFRYRLYHVRNALNFIKHHSFEVQVYMKMYGEWTRVQGWTAGVGAGLDTGGWHCSWCVDPERIRVKLMSAHNGDFPRWGDYPAKLNTTYIRGLIKRGLWFNDVTKLKRYDDVSGPPSLFANRNRYWTLIHNVYEDSS